MYVWTLAISTLAFLATTVIYVSSPRASMLNPVTYYLMTHGLIFVIRPWIAYYYDYVDIYILYQFFPSEGTRITVALGSMLGMIAFVSQSLAFSRHSPTTLPPPTKSLKRKVYLPSFFITCLVLLPIGIYSLGTSIGTKVSGVSTMLMQDGISVNTDQNGYFLTAQMVLGPMAAIFAWLFRFRWWSLLPIITFLIAKAATGGRFPMVMALFTLAILYLIDRGRRWPGSTTFVIGIASLAVFGLIGQDRGFAVRSALGMAGANATQAHAIKVERRPLEGMDFANKEYFEYLVHGIPERSGSYGYFVDNLQLLTEPIPRVLWKDKPIGAPIKMFDLWGWGRPIGITFTLPGEGWAQGGWLGLLIWCGFWGGVFGWIYRRFLSATPGVFLVALYASFIPLMITFIRDGTSITLFRTSLFTVLPVIVWALTHRLLFASRQKARQEFEARAIARREIQGGLATDKPYRPNL